MNKNELTEYADYLFKTAMHMVDNIEDAEDLIDMLIVVGKRLKEIGDIEKANSQFRIALKVMDAFEEDFVETKWFKATVYEYTTEQRKEIEQLISE